MKITILKQKLVRRVALFNIFANLFKIWLNRRELNSHIWPCLQSVLLSQFMENSTVVSENKSEKSK